MFRLLVLAFLSASVTGSGIECISGYSASDQACDDVSGLAFCLSNAEAAGEDVAPFMIVLTREQHAKGCIATRVGRQSGGPSIRTDSGNIVINSGEQDTQFIRYRRQTVSLWGLNDQVNSITTNVTNALLQVDSQITASTNAVESQVSTAISQITATVGSELSEIRDFVDAQCAWPYQYRPSGSEDCAPLTACGQGTYELTAPTTSTDRRCTQWTTCPPGTYEELAPSRYQNRVCRTATACGDGNYLFLQATAKTDTVCNEVSVCASNQWQTTAPTPTSDRVCQNHTVCSSAETEVQEANGTQDRICAGDFSSCAERLAFGQRLGGTAGRLFVTSGMTNVTLQGTRYLTYCYNHAATGAWTLVMRVSRHDSSISFHHNGEGWRREQFKTNIIANYDFRQSANTGWGSNDYISPLYSRMPVNNIMVRNNMANTRYSVWSTNNCVSNAPLHSILAPNTLSCGQRACCNAVYGANSPKHSNYDFLALNGDECGDSEPAAIAIRNGCRGDAETLQMGYTRGGHGNHECWSQGNHWGNLIGMFVLVQ